MRVQLKRFFQGGWLVLFLAAALKLSAQGTAISYQGRLSVSGAPANANYDFRFAVFNAPTNGAQVSVYVTNSAVPVSNGLFSVILDFGPGVFNGTSNGSNDWLDIDVRPAGSGAFTNLVPRQPILPAPYAQFATGASNVLGTIPSTVISGTYSNVVNFSNSTNLFAGTFTGAFTGNGASLTNLNASQITSGTLADARLTTNVALLNANEKFTGTNTFADTNFFTGVNTFSSSNFFTGPNSFTGSNSFTGINTFTNNGNYFVGSFFGNGLVGWIPVNATSTNAMRDAGYLTLNAGLSTVTLPATASLFVGDIVRVSGGGGGGWLVQENSGQSILGNFARYTNGTVAPMAFSPTSQGYGVAGSADGVHMYIVGNDINGVESSSDSGRTWSLAGNLSGAYNSVACSADGKTVYAQPASTSGTIIKSINGGVTWASTGNTATGGAIACTADGSTLMFGGGYAYACSGNGTYRARLFAGGIQVSQNGGGSYIAVPAPAAGVFCVGVSSDCTHLVAGVSNGLLYATSNQGATWTTLTATNLLWSGAWMSPDGSKFAATCVPSGILGGGAYSCQVSPEPNTLSTGSTICGSQGSAVELQYIGNGQFIPVGSSGLLWAN